jgi:hypothetical protein
MHQLKKNIFIEKQQKRIITYLLHGVLIFIVDINHHNNNNFEYSILLKNTLINDYSCKKNNRS